VPVTFHIPGALREFTAGHSKVEIEDSPATLADALSALWILYLAFEIASQPSKDKSGTHQYLRRRRRCSIYRRAYESISAGSQISIVPASVAAKEKSCDVQSAEPRFAASIN